MRIIIITLAICITAVSTAQEIVKNEVDEFTGDTVIETDYTGIARNGLHPLQFFIGFRKVNDNYYMLYKCVVNMGSVFSMDEGSDLMFKFDNGQIITLKTEEYNITCRGCAYTENSLGAFSDEQGIKIILSIDREQLEEMKSAQLEKVRMYTNDGYVEAPISKGRAKKFTKAIDLIL